MLQEIIGSLGVLDEIAEIHANFKVNVSIWISVEVMVILGNHKISRFST